MMRAPEQAEPKAPWGITWAAILDLLAFGFLIAAGGDWVILAVFAACEAMLIFLSIKAWKNYFECFTRREVRKAIAGQQGADGVA